MDGRRIQELLAALKQLLVNYPKDPCLLAPTIPFLYYVYETMNSKLVMKIGPQVNLFNLFLRQVRTHLSVTTLMLYLLSRPHAARAQKLFRSQGLFPAFGGVHQRVIGAFFAYRHYRATFLLASSSLQLGFLYET